MSLIDEALKRARQEAARQDAAAREERYRRVPVIPGLRSRPTRSWKQPLLVALCLVVGIAIGLGLALTRGGSRPAETPEETRIAVASPQPPVPPVSPVPDTPPDPAPLPQAPTAPPVVEEAVEEPAPEPEPPPVRETPPAAPAPDPVEEAARIAAQREIALPQTPAPRIEVRPSQPPVGEPAPAPVTPAPAPEAGGTVQTYQRELPTPGGTLRLNGIAYSDQPVALFDDKVVAPGESVGGYKVVSIEPRRVRLEGPDGVAVVVELP